MRQAFITEFCIFATYHVQQYTEACIISLYVRVACPILGAKSPVFFFMRAVVSLVCSIIFSIYKNNIYTHFRQLFLQMTCYFQ